MPRIISRFYIRQAAADEGRDCPEHQLRRKEAGSEVGRLAQNGLGVNREQRLPGRRRHLPEKDEQHQGQEWPSPVVATGSGSPARPGSLQYPPHCCYRHLSPLASAS